MWGLLWSVLIVLTISDKFLFLQITLWSKNSWCRNLVSVVCVNGPPTFPTMPLCKLVISGDDFGSDQQGALWGRTNLSRLNPEMSSCMFVSHSCCRSISCFSCWVLSPSMFCRWARRTWADWRSASDNSRTNVCRQEVIQSAQSLIQSREEAGGYGTQVFGWDLWTSHLNDVIQNVHVTLEGLAEHHQVSTQLCSSSLTEDCPPLVVDLQQVDLSVLLVLLQFVLTTNDKPSFSFSSFYLFRVSEGKKLNDLQEEREHLLSLPGHLLLGLSSPLLQQESLLLRLRTSSTFLCFPWHDGCSSSSSGLSAHLQKHWSWKPLRSSSKLGSTSAETWIRGRSVLWLLVSAAGCWSAVEQHNALFSIDFRLWMCGYRFIMCTTTILNLTWPFMYIFFLCFFRAAYLKDSFEDFSLTKWSNLYFRFASD